MAPFSGDLEVVKILVENGADVNYRNIDGITPLMNGCSKGNLDIVKFLVDQGSNMDAKNNRGETALFYASSYNTHVEIIKFLIEQGADVNSESNDGKTFFPYLDKKYVNEIEELMKDIEERRFMIKPCKR